MGRNRYKKHASTDKAETVGCQIEPSAGLINLIITLYRDQPGHSISISLCALRTGVGNEQR